MAGKLKVIHFNCFVLCFVFLLMVTWQGDTLVWRSNVHWLNRLYTISTSDGTVTYNLHNSQLKNPEFPSLQIALGSNHINVCIIYLRSLWKREKRVGGCKWMGLYLVKCLSHAAACNFLYLNAVSTEMLTGPCAVQKVVSSTLNNAPGSFSPTVVNMKASLKGITLTDINRK